MEWNDLLAGLSERLGVDLAPDETGSCNLTVEERYSVSLSFDDNRQTLQMIGVVAEDLPDELDYTLLLDILDYSYGAAMTGAPAIGRDSESGLILACLSQPVANLTMDDIVEIFGRFIEFQMMAAQRFAEAEETDTTADADTPEMTGAISV